MGVALPAYDPAGFARRLGAVSPEPLAAAVTDALAAFYEELRRWAPQLSLVGPGAADDLFVRHFGESLAVLPWLPPAPARLIDLGSGAGFPGLVIAAARPDLEVTLVEARERKWAFLTAASRRAGLSCRCLNVRVDAILARDLPQQIGVVTLRALRLPRATFEAMLPAFRSDVRVFAWGGRALPELPRGFTCRRELKLAGSEARFLREYAPAAPAVRLP